MRHPPVPQDSEDSPATAPPPASDEEALEPLDESLLAVDTLQPNPRSARDLHGIRAVPSANGSNSVRA